MPKRHGSSSGSSSSSNKRHKSDEDFEFTSGGGSNKRSRGSADGMGVHTSALDTMADKFSRLSSDLDTAGSRVAAARPGSDAFGVAGQSFGSKVGESLDVAQGQISKVAKATRGAKKKARNTRTSIDDNENRIARSFRSIEDPKKAPAVAAGTTRRADNSGDNHESKRRRAAPSTYGPGTYGNRENEQDRLSEKYGTNVSGKTHQHEHPIGFEPLNRDSGYRRKKGEAVPTENRAPAYQEDYDSHRSHPGTGTGKKMHESGFNSETYRETQHNLISDGRAGDAIQVNQLGYAHDRNFHNSTGTQGGQIADDSYYHQIDNIGTFRRSTGDGNHEDLNLSPRERAEAYLARETARTGQWPSAEQRAEARSRYGVDDDL